MSKPIKLNYFLLSVLFFACSSLESEDNTTFLKQIDSIFQQRIMHLQKYSIDSLLCGGFDFPVGNVNGKGAYKSLIDGKTYDSYQVTVPFGINYSLGIHPGEDWGGTGPSDSDMGQPVYAIGRGVVTDAKDYFSPWGNIVVIRHVFKSNCKIDTVLSVYIHLKDVYVKENQIVSRRDTIGTIGDGGVYRPHLHFEVRKASMKNFMTDFWPSSYDKDRDWVLKNYESPSKFIMKHREIPKTTQ